MSNTIIVCGNCGYEFTSAFQPRYSSKCPICRKNPLIKKYKLNSIKLHKKSNYTPVGLKVKQK